MVAPKLNVNMWLLWSSSFCRTITLNTEDGNFSVSMLLYKDEAFEDRWTTVPSLTLEDDIFVKVFMVNGLE